MPSIDTDDVEAVVRLVAEHPGCTADELVDHVAELGIDPNRTNRLLQAAVRRGALIESRSTYWAVRDDEDEPEGIDG
ncbi:hypothetical protein [Halopenitus persicus]|uniref:MarR family transcriptional regulator n=1 Tax=Halopenitus persicus TaxID=1048396 RepID=A0A1H3JTR9_9EURY|nr:hypothetical protein [Halopenitus persicus]QHS15755.1 hypothetical protein GWK26_00560 [haloarchaeon 3A1-DGR]SDY43312.1 hypothetical protein SAMN05216564_105139 [Halopenitus persicus]